MCARCYFFDTTKVTAFVCEYGAADMSNTLNAFTYNYVHYATTSEPTFACACWMKASAIKKEAHTPTLKPLTDTSDT